MASYARVSLRFFAIALGVGLAGPAWRLPIFSGTARAQDLKDELDALEDPPEDDLSSLGGAAKPAPKSLDALPSEGPSSAATTPKAAEPSLPDADLGEPPASDSIATGDGLESLGPEPVEAMTNVTKEAAGKIVGIDFKQMPDRVRLTIKGDRSVDWSRELRSKRRQVILELRNFKISNKLLKRALDTGEFEGPVALVQAFDSKAANLPSVKVLVQLRQFVDPTVARNGNDLTIDFPIATDVALFKSRSGGEIVIPKTFISATDRMEFKGTPITLSLKDAPLTDVLTMLSKASGKDFILPTGGDSKVSLSVRNMPWDQVLSLVLLNQKLGYQIIGNAYRIVPVAELQSELTAATEAMKKKDELLPLETKIFPVSYAKASDIKTAVDDFKTPRGKSNIDARLNALVMTDTVEVLERITRYIRAVDRQTALILIEGRIVDATKNFARSIGVNWGAGPMASGSSLAGSFLSMGKSGETKYTSGEGLGNLGISLGGLGSLGTVTAALQVGESENKARTIASPRIVVLDNKSATISQGSSVPVVTPGTSTTPATTTFKSIALTLNVTPQVTADGFVLMNVSMNRDLPTGANGQSDTRSIQTELLVESGKTAVIGGVYSLDKTEGESGMPGLRSLPIVGTLFRDFKSWGDKSTELLVFLSPRILNADKAFISRSLNGESADSLASGADTNEESIPDDVF